MIVCRVYNSLHVVEVNPLFVSHVFFFEDGKRADVFANGQSVCTTYTEDAELVTAAVDLLTHITPETVLAALGTFPSQTNARTGEIPSQTVNGPRS